MLKYTRRISIMEKIVMTIDDKKVTTEEGKTILEAALNAGINIPRLCYNEKLKPYGACRLCMVEVNNGKRTRMVASCAYPAQNGLTVDTKSASVIKMRKLLIELLWPLAQDLAKEYGIVKSRFSAEHPSCNMCGLCVRYCAEIKKNKVAYFKGRGIDREVAVLPGKSADCVYCEECYTLCGGGWIVNK